jgi:tripartite-type tricarboxylate transporter receptor subunit TctC
MKKILVILLVLLTFKVSAQTVVPIYWPFSIASTQSNFIRLIVEQANKDQKKYTFILEHKPGAGGSIAVKTLTSQNRLALLGHSSSFFVRPVIYPNENAYKFKDFTPVLVQCTGEPYAIISSKYKQFEQLQKQKFLSIGVIIGSLTEIQARQLRKTLPNTEITIVGFQGTPEITQQVLAGNLDLGVDFPSDLTQWIELNKINVIGISGNISHKNFPAFSKIGITGFENFSSDYMIIANINTEPELLMELNNILQHASRATELKDLYDKDYCKKEYLTLQQSNDLYKKLSETWPVKITELLK